MFAQINGFSVLRQDRNRHGGGLALYISKSYKATISCSLASQSAGKLGIAEYLMCRVQQGKSPPVFVAVVYRPPDIPYSTLIDSDLISDLRRYSVGYDYRIVMGDLNANMLWTAQDAIFIKELACELNLKLVEHGATNHVRDCHT